MALATRIALLSASAKKYSNGDSGCKMQHCNGSVLLNG